MTVNKGPYAAFEILEDEISFSFCIGLHDVEDGKDFQISLSFLDMSVAIGWLF